ncbi:MAG TPA: hypothetical protein VMU82_03090 [Acetobacteraceae bacterium]|nr:hypothetical protein [Acetobacteraceae bacterium]
MPYEWITDSPVLEVEIEMVEIYASVWADRIAEIKNAPGTYGADLVRLARQSESILASLVAHADAEERSVQQFAGRSFYDKMLMMRNDRCKVFGYPLDGIYVGFIMVELDTSSTIKVAWVVSHPLVENAGDILIEYVLRLRQNPTIRLVAASTDAANKYARLGFAASGMHMVLDPSRCPNQWERIGGQWRRICIRENSLGEQVAKTKYMQGAVTGV